MKKHKTILSLTNVEAKKYLLKSKSYFTFDLPTYFNFQRILDSIDYQLESLDTILLNKDTKIGDYDCVNYSLVTNKDGKYQWRKIELIHPVLYVNLVRAITTKKGWAEIQRRFKNFTTDKVICCSVPVIENGSKRETIINWHDSFEQKTIEYALDYEWMVKTDILNCYPSIYTHSIAWSLLGKERAKKEKNNPSLLGNIIDSNIQRMSYGQTNGIPQGSILMDLIAELILAYADKEFVNRNNDDFLNDYLVVRYRDDYRILAKTKSDAESLLKNLSLVLQDLNFKLNEAKTSITNSVILDSLKKDKLEIITKPLFETNNMVNQLISILAFEKSYPNSGQAFSHLCSFYEKLSRLKTKPKGTYQLLSINAELMLENPKNYSICAAIFSKLLSLLNDDEAETIINKILSKNGSRPYADYLEVWLQRITLKRQRNKPYSCQICKKLYDGSTKLWNSDWMNKNIVLEESLIIDESVVDSIDVVISEKEAGNAFKY